MTDESGLHRSGEPDLDLIRAMGDGDVGALDALYARYGSGILSFLVARLNDRQLAEEVLQDVMLAAWRSADRFRGESSVRTWLLTIARNRAINARRRYTPQMVAIDDVYDLDTDETGPQEKVEKRGRRDALRAALDTLPDMQREILVLVFYHGLSEREIAQVLDVAPGTVKSRLHRAKEMLRRAMQGEESH
jgi:RNA polymerase sigma-70 factor (ECF subfamily)